MKSCLKRILALVIVLCLCLPVFTSCKKESSGDDAEVTAIDDNYRTYYEVFVYSFCDSDGDGIGDIQGLISKLDYIKELGFNGIWLMPINQSTTYHKYDVVDYYSIDKQYGTMDDFKQLITECDKRDINVITDYVFNHTSAQNEWFKQATEYISKLGEGEKPDASVCPYVDYYNFVQADSCPNNYHQVAGSKNWYYECVFWDQMPDLNMDSKAVRSEIEKIAKYWLDLGVSGFRLDAVMHYYEGNTEKNIEVLNWFTKYVQSVKADAYIVGELWDSFDSICEYYKSGIPSLFNYAFGGTDGIIIKTAKTAGNGSGASKFAKNLTIVQKMFKESNPNVIDGVFIGNHDNARYSGLLGYDANKIKIASSLELFMTGSAFVYYGDEIGMSGSGIDENKRAPMYWNDNGSDGMTKGPQGMGSIENQFASVEAQKDDDYSIYNYYKNAIKLRNKYPEIARGTVSIMESVEDGNVCAISKEYNNEKSYILYNVSEEPVTLTLTENDFDDIADGLYVGEDEADLDGSTLTIPAYGVVILK